MCKSLVKYLFEPDASRTEFLGASKLLYKHILFYLDEDLPNISPPFFQSKVFTNISPHPIMDLIHYSFAPLILFRVPYTLDLLPQHLSIANGAGGVGIIELLVFQCFV